MSRSRRGLMYILEWWLTLPWPPPMRAWWLRRFGASIGRGAVIHRCHFMNLEIAGFSGFTVGADAHVGPGCLFDLAAPIRIGARAALSPRVMVLTHADPGESALQQRFPRQEAPTNIADDAWLGAGSTVLHGVSIGPSAVVGAASLVREDVRAGAVVAGVPAKEMDPGSKDPDAAGGRAKVGS